jgi:hypothetical protein
MVTSGGGELEALGVLHQAAHCHCVVARRHEDDVAVAQLQQGHAAFEQEVIQAERGAHLLAALDLHRKEAAALSVDAASLVEVVQQAVHAGAVVEARAMHEAADEDAHRLRGGQAGVAVDVGAEHAAHAGVDHALQVLVGRTHDPDRANMRQEDVALRVDDERLVEGVAAPQAHLHAVAHGDQVVGVELGGATTREAAGEEVGAEDVAGEAGAVLGHGRERVLRHAFSAAAPAPRAPRRPGPAWPGSCRPWSRPAPWRRRRAGSG